MRKVRIKSLPTAKDGVEVNTRMWNGQQLNWPAQINEFSEPGVDVRKTLEGVPREDATLEAEKGETIVMNQGGIPTQFKIGGKSHAQGGTPLNAPDGSFVFSKTKSMRIKDENVLKDFGISKNSATPAEIAKRYDVNNYRKILADPDSSDLDRKTAELMISNYNLKLAKLGLVQESMKGFPQGIPAIAMPYIDMMNVNPADFAATQGQPTNPNPDMAKFGGSKLPKAQKGTPGFYSESDAAEFYSKYPDAYKAFLDAFKSGDPKKMQATAETLKQVKTPWYSASWLPHTHEDKLQDLSGILQERATGQHLKKGLPKGSVANVASDSVSYPSSFNPEQEDANIAGRANKIYGVISYLKNASGDDLEKLKYANLLEELSNYHPAYKYNHPKQKEIPGEQPRIVYTKEEKDFINQLYNTYGNMQLGKTKPAANKTNVKGAPSIGTSATTPSTASTQTAVINPAPSDTVKVKVKSFLRDGGTLATYGPGGTPKVEVAEDGSTKTTYPDGRIEIKDPSGKVTKVIPAKGGKKEVTGTVPGYKGADFENIKNFLTPEQAASLDMMDPGKLQHASDSGYGKALTVEQFLKNNPKWAAQFEKKYGKFDKTKHTGIFQKEYNDHVKKVAYDDAIAKGYPKDVAEKMAQGWVNSMGFDPTVKKGTRDPRGIDEAYGEFTSRRFEPNWKPYEAPKTETPAGEEPKTEVAKKEQEPIVPAQQNLNAPWWLQDIVKTAGAAGDFFRVKKYAPWQATPGVHLPEATFYDPTRELAANAEAANIATQGLASFTGPQSFTANAMGIQGQTAKNAADILGRYNNLNVGVANDFEIKRTDILNTASANRANLATGLWDKYTTLNQQFDNAKNMARQNLRQSYIDAVTNKQYTANLNDLYEQYQIDPSTGGRIRWTHGRPIKAEDTSANDFAAQFKKYREILPKDVSNEDIFKVIMNQGKGTVPEGYDISSSLYPSARTT